MDTAARTPGGADLFVENILSHADGLGLDEHQIAVLSRLYWAGRGGAPAENVVSDIASLLSLEQFRAAVARFAASPGLGAVRADRAVPDAPAIEAMVARAFENRTKDRSVVEIELAATVAERLISWSKTFGMLIAAPVAILLLILGLFGISHFNDVKDAADRAVGLVKQAETQVSEATAKIALAERNMGEAVQHANQRSQEAERQLAALQAKSASLDTRVASLGQAVQQIQAQIGDLSAQFETGNKPPGSVSLPVPSDPQLKAYGTWGMDTRTAGALVAQTDFPWHQNFVGLAPGSAAFDSAWRTLGEQDSPGFLKAQRAFVSTRFFQPAVELLKKQCEFDVARRSRTLQEVVFALAVTTGPNVRTIVAACQVMRKQGNWNPDDPDLDARVIKESYASLMNRNPILTRAYSRQMQMALSNLAAEKAAQQ